MAEFVYEALTNIPSIEQCLLDIEGQSYVESKGENIFSHCMECPNCSEGKFTIAVQKCLYQSDESFYVIPLKTGKTLYGFTVCKVSDHSVFRQFESAIHNFVNTVALHIEHNRYTRSLEKQIQERTVELEKSRAFYESIFNFSGDYLTVIDKDFTIVNANTAARKLHGDNKKLLGRKCYAVYHNQDGPCALCPAKKTFHTGENHSSVIPLPNAGDQKQWITLSSFPIKNKDGEIIEVIEAGRDITDLKIMEEDLRKTASENELLLKEVHHRVKNNMNVIISLLNMQLGTFTDERMGEALQLSINRVQSMALVHEYLYQSGTLGSINFKQYIEDFINNISLTYNTGAQIRINADIQDVSLHVDSAIPVSLIINEIITNALKYAFPGNDSGTIHIAMHRLPDNRIQLNVKDDGIGLPANFSISTTNSLGMKLIRGLTEQIQGTLTLEGKNGTSFAIEFPQRIDNNGVS